MKKVLMLAFLVITITKESNAQLSTSAVEDSIMKFLNRAVPALSGYQVNQRAQINFSFATQVFDAYGVGVGQVISGGYDDVLLVDSSSYSKLYPRKRLCASGQKNFTSTRTSTYAAQIPVSGTYLFRSILGDLTYKSKSYFSFLLRKPNGVQEEIIVNNTSFTFSRRVIKTYPNGIQAIEYIGTGRSPSNPVIFAMIQFTLDSYFRIPG